jgi:hypothetical protein
MPRIPKSPVAVAWVLYRAWRQLPPKQRQQVFDMALKHGPIVASKAAAASKKAASTVRKSARS